MLGLEADVFRNARLAQTVAIVRPFLRQIQAIGHRQAGMAVGERQGYSNLTIIFLAKLAAILSRNTDRVPPLLGETGVVDDPRFDRSVPLYRGQHHRTDLGQNLLV